ncbi:MAG TPA: DUF3300 domain-containing protein [Burkholderiales bacterium]|nr:DUF3300 domain-containing protein [Burkholderiales bacterium]
MTLPFRKWFALFALLALAIPFAGQARAAYSQAELDQMLAPIALYPDPLLSQILMAATRPEEVAEAARWSADHRAVEGDTAVQMVQEFDWDPSVKSLVAFPTVLERMGQSPDWTRNLGDAFIAQEPQVMETVQMLRQRAHAQGSLISDERVRIIEEPQAIAIVPANPQAIYVPYYDPWIAYGTWWWSAYPPFAWDPWPGYAYRPYYGSAFWWGAPIGISAGFFFGAIDWPRRYVRIAHTDNYYVRRWIERRQVSGGTYSGRWRPDYWQRRDFSRRGTVTQSQTVAPTVQQPLPGVTTQRQFSGTATHQQAPRPDSQRRFSGTATHQQAPRPDSQRQFSGTAVRQPQAVQSPLAPASAAPRMQAAPPPARVDRAPARAERGPSNGQGRDRDRFR